MIFGSYIPTYTYKLDERIQNFFYPKEIQITPIKIKGKLHLDRLGFRDIGIKILDSWTPLP
jgi:hypothetical protein